jgi:hypothetical protein
MVVRSGVVGPSSIGNSPVHICQVAISNVPQNVCAQIIRVDMGIPFLVGAYERGGVLRTQAGWQIAWMESGAVQIEPGDGA